MKLEETKTGREGVVTFFESLHTSASIDDPALNDQILFPDGIYQKRFLTLRAITKEVSSMLEQGFSEFRRNGFPVMIVGWGKCRVGSTAMANLFGLAGVAAFYQPIKAIVRFRMADRPNGPLTFPPDSEVLFIKETAGPYVPCEALFNPIECLIDAGWPADRLRLLILDREPVATLDSWMEKWGDKIGRTRILQNYLLSTANYSRVRSYAERSRVAVSHFPYEASKEPEKAIQRMFNRVGVADFYSDHIFSEWGAAGDLDSSSKMMYPREPAQYIIPGVHGNGDNYRYRPREVSHLTADEIAVVNSPEVAMTYSESVETYCADLGLTLEERRRLFGNS